MIGPALGGQMQAGRAAFNQLFRAAARSHAGLDGAAFLAWLESGLDPVAEAVAAAAPEALARTVLELYQMALPLVARGWLGPSAREPAIDAGLREVLAALPCCTAQAPAAFAGAVLNALQRLAAADPAKARRWSQGMGELAPGCTDLEDALALGRVLAWRCGLPSLRARALQDAQTLPAVAVQAVLGLPAPLSPQRLAELMEQPQAMPEESKAESAIRFLGWAGGFRGFGGPFARPPRVGLEQGVLVAGDGDALCRLFGDGYGVEAVKVGNGHPRPSPGAASDPRVDSSGTLHWGGRGRQFPQLAGAITWQWQAGLLAVSLATSHRVALLRCPP
jgi:hypothetical protein